MLYVCMYADRLLQQDRILEGQYHGPELFRDGNLENTQEKLRLFVYNSFLKWLAPGS